jgi:hypothetical protein
MKSNLSKTISNVASVLDPTPVNRHTSVQLIRLREDLQSLAELVEVQYKVVNALSDQVDVLQDVVIKLRKRRAKRQS